MADDDLERITCPSAGSLGHQFCGVCPTCNQPRFQCGHSYRTGERG